MSQYSDSIEINTSREAVFDAVSHLEQMGKFSPENTGGEWVNGATGPALGAKFKGTNANESARWKTLATVTTFTPPSVFTFEVTFGPAKIAQWSFVIDEVVGGSRVTESWIDRRSALVRKLARTPVTDRASYTQDSIRTTLSNLKAHLES